MKTYKLSLMAVASLMLAACGADDTFQSEYNDSNAVRISAQINTVNGGFQTKSNPMGTADEQAKFNNGDVISVAAGTQGAVKYTYNGSAWTPESGKLLTWQSASMNFTAFYPGDVDGTSATAFTTPTTYADAADVAKADYMVYTGSQTQSNDNAVTLAMSRKMARIVISNVTFKGTKYTDYSVKSIQISGNTNGYKDGKPEARDIAVIAYKYTDDKYYALLSPTKASDEATFITVTLEKTGANDVVVTATGIPATEAAMSYTYDLTIDGSADLLVTPVTVGDWTDGTFASGKSTEITNPTAFAISDVTKLQNLAYGEKVNLKDIITLTPANAAFSQITWSNNDENSAISVDENGVLSVKYTSDPTELEMTDRTITLTGSVANQSIGTATVTVAGGHFVHDFSDGMGVFSNFALKEKDNTPANGNYTVQTQKEKSVLFDLSKSLRQDIPLAATNKKGGFYVSTAKYKYFAIKIRRPYYYDVDNGYSSIKPGTTDGWKYNKLALNITPTTLTNLGHQSFSKELDMSGTTPALIDVKWNGQPKVYVFDFSGKSTLADGCDSATGLVDMKDLDIVVADLNDNISEKSYEIYWIGTFDSLEAIKAYYDAHE